jgi:hypothetical protein
MAEPFEKGKHTVVLIASGGHVALKFHILGKAKFADHGGWDGFGGAARRIEGRARLVDKGGSNIDWLSWGVPSLEEKWPRRV